MSANKKLLVVFLSIFLGSTLPSYADSINTSLKPSGSLKRNLKSQKPIKCKTKGRNRRLSKVNRAINCKGGSFNNPKIGGLRIDACVRGIGWGKTDPKRCDTRRLKKIASEFCRSKGFNKSFKYSKVSHKGRHAVLTYKKSKPSHSFWKRKRGHALIKNIICQ